MTVWRGTWCAPRTSPSRRPRRSCSRCTVSGYEGSPFSPYDRSIDVLRFESSPQLQYRDVPGYILPLWWLRHSRIPPGAELIRIYDNGTSTLLARYGDVGAGWTVTQLGAPRPSLASLSRCVGPVAKWHGAYLEADVVDSGHTVVLALANPPLAETGFHQSPSGRWYRRVAREDVTELFELDLTARWNGLTSASSTSGRTPSATSSPGSPTSATTSSAPSVSTSPVSRPACTKASSTPPS